MTDTLLLRQLRRGSQRALDQAIEQYSAYVVTVIRNRSRGLLAPEDHEEIAADVFLALWQNAGRISAGSLRSWLGAVARNRTVDFMKRHHETVPLEENAIEIPDPIWAHLSNLERSQALRRALSTLSPMDQEIFYRCYDLGESSTKIAQALNLNPATVRSRLSRGRAALRNELLKGGYSNEAVHG